MNIQHAQPLFPTHEGELLVGNTRISDLAAQIGSTPFYAYDKALITQRVEDLRKALPSAIKLHYAIKANPFPPVIQHLSTLVDGLDVASGGELTLALTATNKPISFAGPGKRREELEHAVNAGILLNVESFRELRELADIRQKTGEAARIAIRINPNFELKTAGMKMSGGAKPFGVDAEQVPEMLAEVATLGLRFEGFHLYAGSQNLKPDAIAEAQRESYDLICRLAEAAPSLPRSINLGGGFGIPYFPGEQRLDLANISETLESICADAAQRFPDTEIQLELGRYLVGEAGIYVTRVIDKKISRGHIFLVTDGGLNHHLAASGNFGQVIRKNYPIAIATRINDIGKGSLLSIVGPLCTPLDILADKVKIGTPEIGDLIAIFQSGAYGASASPHNFLGHPPPREVLV
jgi:diaminopimelate decarboxylase